MRGKWWMAAVNAYLSGELQERYVETGLVSVAKRGNFVLLCYTNKCQKEAAWDTVTRACRGLILDAVTGEVIALPLQKFFNIGEGGVTEAAVENLPDLPFAVYEKVDGSLGILYWPEDGSGLPALASTGSFQSEQAKRGTQMLRELAGIEELPSELTFLFEIVFKGNKGPAIEYDYEGLVLLAINNRLTGEELPWEAVVAWAKKLGCRVAHVYNFISIEDLLAQKELLSADLEGFVIRFANGRRFKFKGTAYLQLLWAVRSVRFADVFLAVVEDRFEEFVASYPEELEPRLREVAQTVMDEFVRLERAAELVLEKAPALTNEKEFAVWVKSLHLPSDIEGIVFNLFRGQPVDWTYIAGRNLGVGVRKKGR